MDYDRSATVEAAQRILDQRGWCLYEACTDIAAQLWEPQALIFDASADAVADVVEARIQIEPVHDGRLTGCDRRTLNPAPEMGAWLCYLAESGARPTPSGGLDPPISRPSPLRVRDATRRVVATVAAGQTVGSAARRMSAQSVDTALVIGGGTPEPSIITDHSIMRAILARPLGEGDVIADHATAEFVYVDADWSIELAVRAVVRSRSRFAFSRNGADLIGVLSMHDLFRYSAFEALSGQSFVTP